MFSFGKENSEGQLGHGDTSPRTLPTMINKLKASGEKINSISCGFKHVICKTNLGKVYTWGSGAFGQLGFGNFNNQFLPKILNIDQVNSIKNTNKVLQVKSGFRTSYVLLNNHKIYWWGTNSKLQKCANPTHFNYRPLLNVFLILFRFIF